VLMSTMSVLSCCPGQSGLSRGADSGRMDGQDTWDKEQRQIPITI
jgi:hypothetical protein